MPDWPDLSDQDYPLPDDWVINDRTAIFMKVEWPMACDFQGGGNRQDVETSPLAVDQQPTGVRDRTPPPSQTAAAAHGTDAWAADNECKHQSISTPVSDCSIKEWVASKAFKTNMRMGEIDGLNVDDIYKIGYAAGLQSKRIKRDESQDQHQQESTLGSSQHDQDGEPHTKSLGSDAASWEDAGEGKGAWKQRLENRTKF